MRVVPCGRSRVSWSPVRADELLMALRSGASRRSRGAALPCCVSRETGDARHWSVCGRRVLLLGARPPHSLALAPGSASALSLLLMRSACGALGRPGLPSGCAVSGTGDAGRGCWQSVQVLRILRNRELGVRSHGGRAGRYEPGTRNRELGAVSPARVAQTRAAGTRERVSEARCREAEARELRAGSRCQKRALGSGRQEVGARKWAPGGRVGRL